MKVKEEFNARLLVEGKDDQHVIWAICQKYAIAQTFDVIDVDGVSEVLKRLPVDIKQNGIRTVAAVLDADQNLKQRWQSLKDTLAQYSYDLPDQPSPQGFIHDSYDIYPRIGIWLMPDNLTLGMLEDFVRLLIRPDDLLSPFVEQSLAQIERQVIDNRYEPIHIAKAFIHTWLAWQKDPGTPMGLALTKTYLDHNADLCLRFVSWLNLLFNAQ